MPVLLGSGGLSNFGPTLNDGFTQMYNSGSMYVSSISSSWTDMEQSHWDVYTASPASAYTTSIPGTSYTTIINHTSASGFFLFAVTNRPNGIGQPTGTFRVTLDGTMREYAVTITSGYRGQLLFHPTTQETNGSKPQSSQHKVWNGNTLDRPRSIITYLPSPGSGIYRGVRFNQSLKVEYKLSVSAGSQPALYNNVGAYAHFDD